MTWPLVVGLTRDVPGDLGDSLLNMWILGWGAEHVPRVLTGSMSVSEFWNANIFHPEPLALSFSEHLFGEVVQILPVYHLTGNLILSYNLLVLASFVLSGLGMYLLVRDLTGNAWAAFVAGLVFAFLPFRIAQMPHIQSLQAQWMPLALYGFRRFALTGRVRPLAGGSAALLMQNWSCGYYLIFFAPFVVVFVLHQMLAAGRLRDWRVWVKLVAAAAVVAAGTLPFLMLYIDAQRVHGFERSMGEVIRFSADVYSYFTAPEALRLWGSVMQAYPKPEGELFFGLVPLVLITVAVVAAARQPRPATVAIAPARTNARRVITMVLSVIIAIQLAGFIGILLTGGFITSFAGLTIRATNPARILNGITIAFVLLLIASPAARARARDAARSPLTLSIVLMLLAMWLSLGPMPQSRGRTLPGLGLYGVLYEYVPGFDGLRVPARYAMIAGLFLSIAAGYGVAALLRRRPFARAIAVAALFLIEAAFIPMPVNQTWGEGAVIPPARIEPASTAPTVYKQLAAMSDARVIAEFPFGDPAWELRYVYYSTLHWKRLLNGYSGGFPQGYKVRVALLQRVVQNADAAWKVLVDTDTTHVIVHRAAFPDGNSSPVEQWLTSRGAVEIGRYGDDVLYARPDILSLDAR